jgi:hypothetical protein
MQSVTDRWVTYEAGETTSSSTTESLSSMPSPSLLVPRSPPSVPLRTPALSPLLPVPPPWSCISSFLSWLCSACATWNCPSHLQL